jgi:hypothetical protein
MHGRCSLQEFHGSVPDRIIVLEAVSEIQPRDGHRKKCVTLLDSKSPIQGPWCWFRRKARARRDIDTVAVGSLKVLDPKRPIREAVVDIAGAYCWEISVVSSIA